LSGSIQFHAACKWRPRHLLGQGFCWGRRNAFESAVCVRLPKSCRIGSPILRALWMRFAPPPTSGSARRKGCPLKEIEIIQYLEDAEDLPTILRTMLEKRTGEARNGKALWRVKDSGANNDMQETAFILGIRCECSAESTTTPNRVSAPDTASLEGSFRRQRSGPFQAKALPE
jgi:hypothetical protein